MVCISLLTFDLDMFQFRPGNEQFALNWFVFPNLIFVKSPYYSLFFYPKKWFHFFFCKTVKITLLRRSHFYRWPNFFLHQPQFMVVFTVLAIFLVVILPKKKTILCGKILFFFSDIRVFFWISRKMPTKKNQISKKKIISLSPQRFLLVYGIKRLYQIFVFNLLY